MADEEDIFRKFLKEKGLKFTPERQAILRLVFETHEHFDAEELLMFARQNGQRVSKATIYRTLDLLVESRLLRRYMFDEKQARYEHIYGHAHHEHLYCVNCQRIFEFTDAELERIKEKVCEQFKFTPTTYSYQIIGYCSSCRPLDSPD